MQATCFIRGLYGAEMGKYGRLPWASWFWEPQFSAQKLQFTRVRSIGCPRSLIPLKGPWFYCMPVHVLSMGHTLGWKHLHIVECGTPIAGFQNLHLNCVCIQVKLFLQFSLGPCSGCYLWFHHLWSCNGHDMIDKGLISLSQCYCKSDYHMVVALCIMDVEYATTVWWVKLYMFACSVSCISAQYIHVMSSHW